MNRQAAKKGKNVLLLFPDQHRGDWMPIPSPGLPCTIDMPNLKRLQEGGVSFSRAVTPSPICAPARACLAAGTGYLQCGAPSNTVDFPPTTFTFYKALRDAGYEVMASGKLDLHKATKFWGESGWVASLGEMGFTRAIDNEGKIDAIVGDIVPEAGNPTGKMVGLVDVEKEYGRGPYIGHLKKVGMAEYHVRDMARRDSHPRDTELTELDDADYCDNWLTQNSLKLLRDTPVGKPWFLQVNFTGPHHPWDVTKSMADRVAGREYPLPIEGDPRFAEQDARIRSRYAAMLENIDRNIGQLLDAIRKRGEADDTVVIYCSDHGEMLADFGLFGKSVPRRASVQVPLVIFGAGMQTGVWNSSLVEMQDLAATILEVAGVDAKLPNSVSLLPLIDGRRSSHRETQISALGNWKSISDGEYKLVVTQGEKDLLFDLRKDEWERHNISTEEPMQASRLTDLLLRQFS